MRRRDGVELARQKQRGGHVSLCIAGAALTRLAVAAFTLSWMHSIEKTRWEEDWIVSNGRLVIVEARIESMGAGMETPPGARFDGAWWRWAPAIGPMEELQLRRSDSQPQGWRLCTDGACRQIGDAVERTDIVKLSACD